MRTSGITGSDVKTSSLTGSDIDESSLGNVPSATTANSATTAGTAGSASTVGGVEVKAFSRAVPSNTLAAVPIASANGFTLLAACDAGGTPSLSVDTTKDDTTVQYAHTDGANAPVGGRDTNVDSGDTPEDVDEAHTNGSGTITAGTADGSSLTVTLSFDENNVFGAVNACAFVGTAIG